MTSQRGPQAKGRSILCDNLPANDLQTPALEESEGGLEESERGKKPGDLIGSGCF